MKITKYYNRPNKYHNKKVLLGGVEFHSIKEAERYQQLLLLQRAGAIQDLKRQVKFELIPSQYEDIPTGELYKRGERKGTPKMKRVCVEEAVSYYADFTYTKNGKTVVEDTKGVRTPDYIIKRKMLLYFHGIKIKEI